jgi:hypothetical protein
MVELTWDQIIVIARAAVDMGNAVARSNGVTDPALIREWDSFGEREKGLAMAGIAGTVKAMQLVGYKVTPRLDTELEGYPTPVEDPQGLVTSNPDGSRIQVYPSHGAPPCDALVLTPAGVEKLIAILQAALSRADGIGQEKKEGA